MGFIIAYLRWGPTPSALPALALGSRRLIATTFRLVNAAVIFLNSAAP
jgi:hypothetical protein